MANNQIPQPPVDMVMPAVYNYVLIANFAVLALLVVWIIHEARRHKSFIPILMMIGATLASLTEVFWDVLGLVWYPQTGHVPFYRAFNVTIPLWMLAAYPCYLGAQGYWFYRRLTQGITYRQFWMFYAFTWVTNILLEVPVIQLGVYTYYGPQPFMFFGFPLWQAMGNSLMPMLIGIVIFTWRDVFAGWRGLLVIPAIPVAQIFALGGVGWPSFLALNSGLGYAATYPAAIATFVLSLMFVYLTSTKLCEPSSRAAAL